MPHTIRLRTEPFTKAMRLAGFHSDYALARAMDLNRSTVTRVLTGQLHPGPAFTDLFDTTHTNPKPRQP
ncbi:hypothetical protein ACFV4N_39775 [Actinosynnema sp. NPDC059797]